MAIVAAESSNPMERKTSSVCVTGQSKISHNTRTKKKGSKKDLLKLLSGKSAKVPFDLVKKSRNKILGMRKLCPIRDKLKKRQVFTLKPADSNERKRQYPKEYKSYCEKLSVDRKEEFSKASNENCMLTANANNVSDIVGNDNFAINSDTEHQLDACKSSGLERRAEHVDLACDNVHPSSSISKPNVAATCGVDNRGLHCESVHEDPEESVAEDAALLSENLQTPTCDTEDSSNNKLNCARYFKFNTEACGTATRKYFLRTSRCSYFMKPQKKKIHVTMKKQKKLISPFAWKVPRIDVNGSSSNSEDFGNASVPIFGVISAAKDVPMQIKVSDKLVPPLNFHEVKFQDSAFDIEPLAKFPFRKERNINAVSEVSEVECEPSYVKDNQSSPLSQCEKNRLDSSDNMPPVNVGQEIKPVDNQSMCYIFAILDKVKQETLLKCSTEIKASQMLNDITKVLGGIAAEDDVIFSSRVVSTETSSEQGNNETPILIDRSISPILPPPTLVDKDTQVDQDILHELSVSQLYGETDICCKSMEEQSGSGQGAALSTTTKIIVSRALLNFLSKLCVFTEPSLKILSWCCIAPKGDIDSEECDDEFEGFLRHCHDNMSIVIECVSILDSKQILNMDEKELRLFWLLHDATCCILQAYRYLQGTFEVTALSQKVLSLMTVTAKMILPSSKMNLEKWISSMTMFSEICKKMLNTALMSDACQCLLHFSSLVGNRSCRLCEVDNLYQEKCKSTKPTSNQPNNEVFNHHISSSSILSQLFPRFYWFMEELEKRSEEDFKSSLAKHVLAKFSCNIDCGLYPCDEHLSVNACVCFSQSMNEDAPPIIEDDTTKEKAKSDDTTSFKDQEKECLNGSKNKAVHPQNVLQEEMNSVQRSTSKENSVIQDVVSSTAPSSPSAFDCIIEQPMTSDETGKRSGMPSEGELTVSQSMVCQPPEGDLPKDGGSVTSSIDLLSVTSQDYTLQLNASSPEIELGYSSELEVAHQSSQSESKVLAQEEDKGVQGNKSPTKFGSHSPSSSIIDLGSSSSETNEDYEFSGLGYGQWSRGNKKFTGQNHCHPETVTTKLNEKRVSLSTIPEKNEEKHDVQNLVPEVCSSQELLDGVSTCAISGSISSHVTEEDDQSSVTNLRDYPGPLESPNDEKETKLNSSKSGSLYLMSDNSCVGSKDIEEEVSTSVETNLIATEISTTSTESNQTACSLAVGSKPHVEETLSRQRTRESKRKCSTQESYGSSDTLKSSDKTARRFKDSHRGSDLKSKLSSQVHEDSDEEAKLPFHSENLSSDKVIPGKNQHLIEHSDKVKKKGVKSCLSKSSVRAHNFLSKEKTFNGLERTPSDSNESDICEIIETHSSKIKEVDMKPKKKAKSVTFCDNVKPESEGKEGSSNDENNMWPVSFRLRKRKREETEKQRDVEENKSTIGNEMRYDETLIERSLKRKKSKIVEEEQPIKCKPAADEDIAEPKKKKKTLRLTKKKENMVENVCESNTAHSDVCCEKEVKSTGDAGHENLMKNNKLAKTKQAGIHDPHIKGSHTEKREETKKKMRKETIKQNGVAGVADSEDVSSCFLSDEDHSKHSQGSKTKVEKDSKSKKKKSVKFVAEKKAKSISKHLEEVERNSDSSSRSFNDSNWNQFLEGLRQKYLNK